jgi:uncharacterized protein (DUF697 family)
MRKIMMLGTLVLTLGGCAAVQTAVSHRNLDVQSRMSATIFLDPIPASERKVLVQVRNTSDKPDLDLTGPITQAIAAKGYAVVDDPSLTHYVLQVNVLQCGEMSPSAAEQAFRNGYGSTLGGALGGAAVGGLASGTKGAVVGAVVGGVGSAITDAAVKNVTYTVITDVQISEISAKAMTERTNQKLTQGTAGTRDVSGEEISNWKRYQTRVLSTANQVNLDFADAVPQLQSGIARSIVGTF